MSRLGTVLPGVDSDCAPFSRLLADTGAHQAQSVRREEEVLMAVGSEAASAGEVRRVAVSMPHKSMFMPATASARGRQLT
jgi:hypothetical protein